MGRGFKTPLSVKLFSVLVAAAIFSTGCQSDEPVDVRISAPETSKRQDAVDVTSGIGYPCDEETPCESGFCVDNVCCQSACDGGCERCDGAGECVSLVDACQADSDCDSSQYCPGGSCVCQGGECLKQCATVDDCGSVCAFPTMGCGCVEGVCRVEDLEEDAQGEVACGRDASCGGGFGASGSHVAQGASFCKADRSCVPGPGNDCGLFACEETVADGIPKSGCRDTCSEDSHCAVADAGDLEIWCYAEGGECTALDRVGSSCTLSADCASGACVDGKCCESACDSLCYSCNQDYTGEDNGLCRLVLDGSDPGNDCANQGQASCGLDGQCDGAGACRFYADGTVCSDAVCSNRDAQYASTCTGKSCVAPPILDCGPYACASGACLMDCGLNCNHVEGARCYRGATCTFLNLDGEVCGGDGECASGHCVDGVCCESACDGNCESCVSDYTGFGSGQCRSVLNGQDPDSDCTDLGVFACSTDGVCNGQGDCREYPDSTLCYENTCDGTELILAAQCLDGGCPVGPRQDCGLYNCADGACRSDCFEDQHCDVAEGAWCFDYGIRVTQLSVNKYHGCAIDQEGRLSCWGTPGAFDYGQVASPEGQYSQVANGELHTCALRSDGTLHCWGRDNHGQASPPDGIYSQVVSGRYHSCARASSGAVTCWGKNSYGEGGTPGGSFSTISAGRSHNCGVRSTDGAVECWGRNDDGQSTPPSGVFASVSAGVDHSCGVKSDGSVRCWGNDASGQSSAPGGAFGAVVAAGNGFSCGVKADGVLECWGDSSHGQTLAPAGAYTDLAGGFWHACAVYTDEKVACWGSNNFGQTAVPAELGPGICSTKLKRGDACSSAGQCASGYCVDGHCCESSCSDLCTACASTMTGKASGECEVVSDGLDPRNDCANQGAASCGQDGSCDGGGACRLYSDGTVCLAPLCVNGDSQVDSTCQSQTCIAPVLDDCGAYACNSGACMTDCSGGCNAAEGGRCFRGTTCTFLKLDGEACGAAGECASGNCVDGVCCDGACTGGCQSCVQVNTGFADGMCRNSLHGLDPRAACGAYACSNGACLDTCEIGSDADCDQAEGARCYRDSVCTFLNFDGEGCGADVACASSYCVDGVCCDTACGALCESCVDVDTAAGDGVCAGILAGFDPDAECTDEGVASCQQNGACDGGGQCELYPDLTQCSVTTCSGANQILGTQCSSGVCPAGTVVDCGDYACSGAACLTSCTGDQDCDTDNGAWCYDRDGDGTGECTTLSVNGASCGADNTCASGFCAEGTCCDTACESGCEACVELYTGQTDGTCAPTLDGEDPWNDCPNEGWFSCGLDGACDGAGECRRYAEGTVCQDAACILGDAQQVGQCSGGACDIPAVEDCSLYACDSTPTFASCRSDCEYDSHCATGDGAYCYRGECTDKGRDGDACGSTDDCASGFCVDGICCEEACDDACQSCSVQDTLLPNGVCGAASNGLDPGDHCGAYVCRDGACLTSCQTEGYAAVDIAGSGKTSCAVNEFGAVDCWGWHGYGTQVAPSDAFGSISVGLSHACGVTTGNAVTCWGDNSYGEASAPDGAFVSVGVGETHSCALDGNGGVRCWGQGTHGQTVPPHYEIDTSVTSSTGVQGRMSVNVTRNCPSGMVGVGYSGKTGSWYDHVHLICQTLDRSGTLSGGYHHTGQIGRSGGGNERGNFVCPSGQILVGGYVRAGDWLDYVEGRCKTPASVAARSDNDNNDSAPGLGNRHGGANRGVKLCSDGQAVTGLSGRNTFYPASLRWNCSEIDGAIDTPAYASLAANRFTTCGIEAADGSLQCWGEYTWSSAQSYTSVAVGYGHACALRSSGTIDCFGSNSSGQASPPSGQFSAVSAGKWHSCGVKSDGTMDCWGNNNIGQSTEPSGTFTDVALGYDHSCGIKSNGGVDCWGSNVDGQSTPPIDLFVGSTIGGDIACDQAGGASCYNEDFCTFLALDGEACGADGACASGHCVGGICCSTACDSNCQSCSQVDTGFANGTCANVFAGIDPRGHCSDQGASSCGQNGLCDGSGGCQPYVDGTVCASDYCDGTNYVGQASCSAQSCTGAQVTDCGLYGCEDAACLMSCSDDSDCDTAAGGWCFTPLSMCTDLKRDGESCGASAECASSQCVDGVCCESSCQGSCYSCNAAYTSAASGTCALVDAGLDPRNHCADQGAASCGTSGACDGGGGCQTYSNGTVCSAAVCTGGDAQGQSTCDGGSCVAPAVVDCALYACEGAQCRTTCQNDGHCAGAGWCYDGGCTDLKRNGESCSGDGQCATGECVDGVCCESACLGGCRSCLGAETGFASGLCRNVSNGRDPDNDCGDQGVSSCGQDGYCDGAGSCRPYADGTVCGASSCSGAGVYSDSKCVGGSCTPQNYSDCGAYNCSGGTCLSSCTVDGHCDSGSGFWCWGGSCTSLKRVGDTCAQNNQCASGVCVGGVCCDGACDGGCWSCNSAHTGVSNGTCSAVLAGSDPRNACLDQGSSSCGLDGQCDGSGGCSSYGDGTICSGATCSNGDALGSWSCSSGACVAPSPVDCGLYACNGSNASCYASCANDGQCNSAAGGWCYDGSCTNKKKVGDSCSSDGQCANGLCVDGYCCDSGCTGTCQSCAGAYTGLSNGACGYIVADTDPGNECSDSGAASCGQNGFCNGLGACDTYDAGTVCAADSCNGHNLIQGGTCSNGSCVSGGSLDCGAYSCSGNSCRSSCSQDSHCDTANGAWCYGGTCTFDKHTGEACTSNGQCATGHCVDGYCCENSCTGNCQSCDGQYTSGANGQCRSIYSGYDPYNDCGSEAVSTCGRNGFCNGAGGCGIYANGTQCQGAGCSGHNRVIPDYCNGSGTCNDSGLQDCGLYTCRGGACLTSCNNDNDCDTGAGGWCNGGTCTEQRPLGQACSAASECVSGHCIDGVCCQNNCTGGCRSCNGADTGHASGYCHYIPSGQDPGNECSAQNASTCGRTGACDGGGGCQQYADGTICADNCCSGSSVVPDAYCNAGSCYQPASTDCGLYACSGCTCRNSCSNDSHCANGAHCFNNACSTNRGPSLGLPNSWSVNEDTASTIEISSYASDPEGNSLTYQLGHNNGQGSFSINANSGRLHFSPHANVCGRWTGVNIIVFDGEFYSSWEWLWIWINCVDDPPTVKTSGNISLDHNASKEATVCVWDNDTNEAHHNLSVSSSNGGVINNGQLLVTHCIGNNCERRCGNGHCTHNNKHQFRVKVNNPTAPGNARIDVNVTGTSSWTNFYANVTGPAQCYCHCNGWINWRGWCVGCWSWNPVNCWEARPNGCIDYNNSCHCD